MKVIITPSKNNKEQVDFPSLRTALEWAKNNQKTELYLTKIIIKNHLYYALNSSKEKEK